MPKPDNNAVPDRKDLYSGLVFVGIGLLFAGHSTLHTIGTPLRMGPGFFPLIVSLLMGLMGILIIVQAVRRNNREATEEPHPIAWRGMLLTLAGPIVFALTISGLGLVPATALVVAMGAFANADMSWRGAIVCTVLVTLSCIAIFAWGLGLPLRLFGTWIS